MLFQRKPWLVPFGIFLTFTLLFSSCEKDPVNQEITKEKVSGYVQKGPYINGTQILMAELNASMEQTGNLFSTQISDNMGSFEINNIALASSFVEFSANGFYFDEVKGDLSAAQLTLFALSDITDINTVNVNLLTHLERRRVEYLVKNGTSFSQAKAQAQAEILAVFGFEREGMQQSENLNISINNEDNAILLAISVILQGNRSVGDLSELLAGISTDMRQDGVLNSETILEDLRASGLQLNLSEIRENLITRYQTLGITANIPDFETYVTAFLSYTSGQPFASTQNPENISTTEAALKAFVNPNSAETQVIFEYGITEEYGNTISAEQSPINGNMGVSVYATINELTPATTYHYRVKAENEHGVYYGQDRSFTTLGEASDAITEFATNITITGAKLNGKVNPNLLSTTVIFEFGATTSFGSEIVAIQSPVTGDSEVNVSADLDNLQPGTNYYYRVKAENDLGISYANIVEFKTLGDKPDATAFFPQPNISSAILNGIVNPNLLITNITFEWGTTTSLENSIMANQSPVEGSDNVFVDVEIFGLQANTEYHFRIKAENSVGITYSETKSFKTYFGTVTDVEGNVYKTTMINGKQWMSQDLRTKKFSDGTLITNATYNNAEWESIQVPAYAIFPHLLLPGINSDQEMIDTYGLLYNGFVAADTKGVCPTGWSVPTENDWHELGLFLSNEMDYVDNYPEWWRNLGAANSLKSTRTEPDPHPRWPAPNIHSNNSTLFSAYPTGVRQTDGEFDNFDRQYSFYWTKSQCTIPIYASILWAITLGGPEPSSLAVDPAPHQHGFAIRCVKD